MIQDKYKQYLKTKVVPTLNKEAINELNKLRQEHFHKNIDRNCKDCIKSAFLEVGDKLWGEEKITPVKKKQSFPEHKPVDSKIKSIAYGALGDKTGKYYFGNLAHRVAENFKIKRIKIETAYHYNCHEGSFVFHLNNSFIKTKGYDSKCRPDAFEQYAGYKAITKSKPKSIKTDLLVFLSGTKEELEKVLEITECKYIHTHIQLDNELPQRPKLVEGKLYSRNV